MYMLVILCTIYVNVLGESCTTPLGQLGECVPIKSCPSLLWSFANFKFGVETYLKKFVCSNDELGLIVCCVGEDSLVFENDLDYDIKNLIYNGTLSNSKNCGITSKLETHNGTIRLQDFPWLIKIMAVNNNAAYQDRVENVGCTGVLISDLYALYSAQCYYSILHLDKFVRIETYTGKEENCNGTSYSPKCSTFEIYEIDAYEVHPFYDAKTKLNDLIAIRLSRRVQYSDVHRPICLPLSGYPPNVDEVLQTAGWTKTYKKHDLSVKRIQFSTLISNAECQKKFLESGSNITITSYEMCTQVEETVADEDVFGFPLMFLQDNRWYLQGFVQQGKNTKVHLRFQNYLQWQHSHRGGELCYVPFNNNTLGACMHFSDCPMLLDAFANPSTEDILPLKRFGCRLAFEKFTNKKYILKGCCEPSFNFIIPSQARHNLDFDVSNFKYCGFQHRDDYILEDDSIAIDEFPWLAVILNATLPEQKDRVCGGTLISHRYVITSARCSFYFHLVDSIIVRLGDYNINYPSYCIEFSELGAIDCNAIQEYKVEENIPHPFYNRFTFTNNIALLRLNQIVEFTNYVRPICVPRSEDDLAVYGQTLFITGFGKNPDGTVAERKKKIQTSLISNDECREKMKLFSIINPITPYQICSEDHPNSTDINCTGDDGGPVMSSKKVRWFIEGLSSTYTCRQEEPQAHLKIYKYLKWIKLSIKD